MIDSLNFKFLALRSEAIFIFVISSLKQVLMVWFNHLLVYDIKISRQLLEINTAFLVIKSDVI